MPDLLKSHELFTYDTVLAYKHCGVSCINQADVASIVEMTS